jgi:hypothetical protein
LVYAIAAYTITIGTLAIYAVLIQYRQRVAFATLAQSGGVAARDPRTGFNLGAALLAPFWMWANGLRMAGASLLAVTLAIGPLARDERWIPLLFVVMIPVAAGAALGFAGNRIAYARLGTEDPAAFAASQLPWAIAGIVLHAVVLPWACFFLMG